MPKPLSGPNAKEDAASIAAYLASLTAGGDVKIADTVYPTRQNGLPEGEAQTPNNETKPLYERLHCIGCHNPPGATAPDPKKLSQQGIAAKFPAGKLADFLRAPGLIQQCIERVRFRGRVVVAGVCITPDSFSPAAAVLKEVALHFVLAYERRDFERTVDWLERGSLRPGAMITDRIGLDDVPAAFDALERPSDQGKLLVTPWARV